MTRDTRDHLRSALLDEAARPLPRKLMLPLVDAAIRSGRDTSS